MIPYSVWEANIKQTGMDSRSEQDKSKNQSHTEKLSCFLGTVHPVKLGFQVKGI